MVYIGSAPISPARNTDSTAKQSTDSIKKSLAQATIIVAPTPIETCPLRTGFARINVESFMGDHYLADRPLAVRCMIGSLVSLLNLGRKGEAKVIWEMGMKAFGEEVWKGAVEECLKFSGQGGDSESCDGEAMPVGEK